MAARTVARRVDRTRLSFDRAGACGAVTAKAGFHVSLFRMACVAVRVVTGNTGEPVAALLEAATLLEAVRLEKVCGVAVKPFGRYILLGPVTPAANLVDPHTARLA